MLCGGVSDRKEQDMVNRDLIGKNVPTGKNVPPNCHARTSLYECIISYTLDGVTKFRFTRIFNNDWWRLVWLDSYILIVFCIWLSRLLWIGNFHISRTNKSVDAIRQSKASEHCFASDKFSLLTALAVLRVIFSWNKHQNLTQSWWAPSSKVIQADSLHVIPKSC